VDVLFIFLRVLDEGGLRSDHDSSGEMDMGKYVVLSCTFSVYLFLCYIKYSRSVRILLSSPPPSQYASDLHKQEPI
jgi:hypothetical protein